jgi:hypothetical protein
LYRLNFLHLRCILQACSWLAVINAFFWTLSAIHEIASLQRSQIARYLSFRQVSNTIAIR